MVTYRLMSLITWSLHALFYVIDVHTCPIYLIVKTRLNEILKKHTYIFKYWYTHAFFYGSYNARILYYRLVSSINGFYILVGWLIFQLEIYK